MRDDVRVSVVESLDDAVVVTDAERVIVAWNAAMVQLTGRSAATSVGCSVDEALVAFPLDLWKSPLAAALAGERGHGDAVAIEAVAGARVWLEARSVPRGDAPGGVLVFRDVTEARRRALFMRALETVGHSLTSSLDLDQVLDTIVGKTRDVMGADSAMVVSWDGAAPAVTVLRVAGRLSEAYAPGGSIPVAGGPIAVAVREGRAVAAGDILADPQWRLDAVRRRHVEQEGFKAVAAAPLLVKGTVQGALVVHQWSARTFTEEDRAVLLLLADHAALAIENARLYRDARRRADRLRELAQLEQMVTASLDPGAVLDAIVEAAARLVGADAVQVWTAEPAVRRLRLRASTARATLPTMPETIRFGEGVTGRTAVARTPIYVADVSREPGALAVEWARASGIVHLFAVPMMAGDEVVGVVTVRSSSASLASEEDRALITTLAAQAAGAVHNAAAYALAVARAARLQTVVAVTRAMAASLDTADVLRRIVDAAAAIRPRALASVHVIHPERAVMQVTSGPEMAGLPHERAVDVGLPALVVEQRRPVLVAEPLTHPRTAAQAWWSERPTASYYGVPIIVGDTLAGVLDYVAPDGVPDQEEQEALNLLAAHAGVAMRNASLYQAEHVQSGRIRALAAVNRHISSTLDLDELLQLIAESAGQLTGVRVASFWLADDRTRTLTYTSPSLPAAAQSFPRHVATYDEGPMGWIARHHEPLLIDDVFADDRMLVHDWWRQWSLHSFAGYPVTADGELLAILALSHAQPLRLDATTQDVLDMFLAQAAVAVRNAGLYRHAARRRDAAEAIARLGRGLSATLDVDRIAALVARGAVELVGARGCAVYRYEPRDGTLHTITSVEQGGRPGRTLVLQAGEGLSGRAIAERSVVTSEDLLHDPALTYHPSLRGEVEALGHRGAIAVPLLTTHGPIGALVVRVDAGRHFTSDEMQALQAFADEAVLALENARLYAESERERREAHALADAARSLALSLDLDEVGERLVQAVLPVFAAHGSSLFRLAPDGQLVAVAFGGAQVAFARGQVFPKGVGIVARCVQTRSAAWVPDVLADPALGYPEELQARVHASGTRAALAVPLNVKSRIVGALAVTYAEPQAFAERDVALLQAFADQAALALENAQLYASARDNLAQLRETQAQLVLAAKLGALGQLVSGVAHELNNPLSVIIGYGQLLLARDIAAPLRRPVELMVAQGDRMAKIVRNLLYFARQRPPERTAVQLSEVIEETLALRLNQLSVSGIAVRREYADGLPAIAADSHQLQQVFLNLILNAEQAILGLGRGGEIVLRTAPGTTPQTVMAQVVDDGPGIAPDALAHIFEPFYTTKDVGEGTGLGLSVSYGIVQEHGGRLTVESRPGVTTFTVELPVRSTSPRSAVIAAPAPPPGVAGRIALVVEDEPAVRDLIVTLLGERGWRVEIAGGGKAGLERIRRRRYDLVVSDMRMPEGGGDELYRNAVAHDATLAPRFLFITGDTANPAAWRFLRDAKVAVLEKPFTAAAFMDAVHAIVTLTADASSA